MSLLLILLGMYLICPCRDAPPLYYPASKCSGSLPQKLLIPLFLLIGGGAAGVVPVMEELYAKIVDSKDMVPHSCIDPTRYGNVIEQSKKILRKRLISLPQKCTGSLEMQIFG